MYVGNPCQPSKEKSKDFAMVASLHPEREWFHSRRDICSWIEKGTPEKALPYQVSHCGQGDQFPALEIAKYGLYVRGDTWGSNRLIDTLLSRTVPLLTNAEQIKILPDFVRWHEISYLVNVSTEEGFHDSLQHILSLPESEYETKQASISRHFDLFDHTKGNQFDAYMLDLYGVKEW